ncbi:hypothetical protein O6H91_17G050500 [Diphasiastrum complanatum]|uniref:Uncharacterized protein n=1 Tax=Diphasiastrum complanatum TaxID=34168 RepID=A0ACC2B6U6_DIPCM|nr:hypothetical protein O6H91_17G050500 [Diphasiastrum complanatum]
MTEQQNGSVMLNLSRILSLLVLCVAVSFCARRVEGSVHEYVKARFTPWENGYTLFGGSEGLYTASENFKGSGVANGKSFIQFETTFQRTSEAASRHDAMEHSSGLVQAIMFEFHDRDKIGGSSDSGHTALCCTPDIATDFGCNEGEVILRSSDGWPKSYSFHFKGNDTQVKTPIESAIITKSGLYTLYFATCDPQLKDLVMNGRTIWKNPSGYLPGRMAPLLTFYGVMSAAYILLAIAWFFQYVRFSKDILQLQNWITVVIALGMSEMGMWYFEYANFNATGKRPIGITTWAVTLGAVKKTISRLLILVVSMGYGVVRPTLGGLTSKVNLLGAAYFVSVEALDVLENARKQYAKLELYRKFTNSLAVAVVVSIIWIGYEFYFKSTDAFNQRWQGAWIISAFWIVISFVLLCVICALWAPSKNSTRYAYSEEVKEDIDDEETTSLTGVKINSFELENESSSLDKKDKKLVNTDVFSLEDDTEEHKLE